MISKLPSLSRRLAITRAAILTLLVGSATMLQAASDPYLIEVKKLVASDGAARDEFGFAAGISGDTAVVSSLRRESETGFAYVFQRNAGGTNNWSEVKKLTVAGGRGRLGVAVAIDGDTIIVGAEGEAHVFERNAGGPENWGQVTTLLPNESNQAWGYAVGVSGDTIVVGAGGAQIRAAYVFERNNGGPNNWGQIKRLRGSETVPLDFFGRVVAIEGDTIVAGAPGGSLIADSEQAGTAYIFQRNQGGANNWGEVRKLSASDGARNDQFGISVAVNGDVVVVGAHQDDVGSSADEGSAYLFERHQGGTDNWGLAKKLTGSDGESRDGFGTSVGVSGDRVVVGENLSSPRKMNVFHRNEGATNNWGEFQLLNPSGPSNAIFGYAVGISGGTIVLGTPWDKIGGNTLQGSAYIFDTVTGPNPTIRGQTMTVSPGQIVGGAIAAVSDDATPPGNLTVEIVSSPPGITLSNIQNEFGRISGALSVSCSVPAGSYSVGLRVWDAGNLSATDNLIVNVTPNTAPTMGTYPAIRVSLGGSTSVMPSAQPGDNGGVSSQSASAPGFTGSLSVLSSGVVIISNSGPPGDHTITVTATDNCGVSTSRTFALTVLGQTGLVTVNTTTDNTANDGTCSLREAIAAANSNSPSGALAGECVAGLPGTDTIAFNIPGGGPQSISPSSALPIITEPVIVDGLTQPGANGATWPPPLKIVLNGSNAGGGAHGLNLGSNAVFSTVRGLVINQFSQSGIHIQSTNNTIECNFLGTDATGTQRMANSLGVRVQGSSNLIGGTIAASRNLISGNSTGISLLGTGNRVEGNFIGTDVTGTLDLGNALSGVRVSEAGDPGSGAQSQTISRRDELDALFDPPNIIGGPAQGARNIISGNDQNGIHVRSENPAKIEGNFIGTDVTGTARLGNSANGVWIDFSQAGTIVGGQETSRNIISANGAAGIRIAGVFSVGNVVWGNYIGTDVTGSSNLGNSEDGVFIGDTTSGNQLGTLIGTYGFGLLGTASNTIAFNGRDGVRVEGVSNRNSISYNSIFSNAGLAINLGPDGVTPNDADDGDTGPNGLQNFPLLTSAITDGTSTTIQGTLTARPDLEYTIQFFSSVAADPSGHGEGQIWVGEQVIHTDGGGQAAFTAQLLIPAQPGRLITATAALTDLTNSNEPDRFGTSEFSPGQVVDGIGASPPSQLLNISTRLRVLNGENVLIGGFIITGTDAKKVIIRGIGPSLAQFFNGTLDDPVLELYQGNTLIDGNNDWKSNEAAIAETGIPPSHDLESAIVRTLSPGAYTAIVRSNNNAPGIGLVEAYDLDQAANSKLANISTRGFVDSGNNVMIGGFIIGGGDGGATVVLRAIGPALGNLGINGALQDPTLDLVDANGTVLRANNDWRDSQGTEIESLALPPGDERECALIQTLAPGNYTAIVRGKDNTTGVGLVEVYNVE